MIERDDASSLHYEFRLEIGGALVSWAIPSEPSLDPGDKRLAIRTGDVPVERAAPTTAALVWDSGTFDNITNEPVERGLTAGRLNLWLEGRRLRGAFDMIRTRESPVQEQWLLIKRDDRDTTPGGRAHAGPVVGARTPDDTE